jgi:hypothetical protein
LPIISYGSPHDINPPRHSLSGVEEFITPVEDTCPMVTYLKYDLFHNWLGLSGRVSYDRGASAELSHGGG